LASEGRQSRPHTVRHPTQVADMTRTLSTIPTTARSRLDGPSARFARVRRAAAELTPAAIEAIAHRVVQLITERQTEPNAVSEGHAGPVTSTPAFVDAATLARHLGLTRGYVYQHANELGAIRLGDGPRARLRFDLSVAALRLPAGGSSVAPAVGPVAKPSRGKPSNVQLLPISPPRGRGVLSRLGRPRRRSR
jgi:hypothetical protein